MDDPGKGRFGPFLEKLRLARNLSLRQFCLASGSDPANISRLERGLLPPPKGRDILERYAEALGLKEGTDDWYSFFDFAATDQGMVPKDILDDKELAKALPAFFRTLRGSKPTPEELRKVADKIRKGG